MNTNDTRYIKTMYYVMLRDLDYRPDIYNWAKSIKTYFGQFRFLSCFAYPASRK